MQIKKFIPIALVAAIAGAGIISMEKGKKQETAFVPSSVEKNVSTVSDKALPVVLVTSESDPDTYFFSPEAFNKVSGGFNRPEQYFTFRLSAQGESPMPVGSSGTIKRIEAKANETADFGPIPLHSDLSEAVYSLVLEPPAPAINGFTWDQSRYEIRIQKDPLSGSFIQTITRNGTPAETIQFENHYAAKPTSVELKLTNQSIPADGKPARFLLNAEAGAPLTPGFEGSTISAELSSAGTIYFGNVTFTEPGTYRYTIREDVPNGTVIQADVEVLDFDGVLTASVRYRKDGSGTDKMLFGQTDPAEPDPLRSEEGESTALTNENAPLLAAKAGEVIPTEPTALSVPTMGPIPTNTTVPSVPTMGPIPTNTTVPSIPTSGPIPTNTTAPGIPTMGPIPTNTTAPGVPTMGPIPTNTTAPGIPTMGPIPTNTTAPGIPTMGPTTVPQTISYRIPLEIRTSPSGNVHLYVTLSSSEGSPLPTAADAGRVTVLMTQPGPVDFGPIEYKTAGIYRYEIRTATSNGKFASTFEEILVTVRENNGILTPSLSDGAGNPINVVTLNVSGSNGKNNNISFSPLEQFLAQERPFPSTGFPSQH